MKTHYTPVDDGYQIIGSKERFNRTLYGGHRQDHLPEKYFTFAGDQPIIMGAISDWRKRADCAHAKCGVFMTGIALAPGLHIPIFYYHGEKGGDRTAEWFHQSEGTVTTFRNGWMEYDVRPFFQCAPKVNAFIEVLPLQTEDGFFVNIKISSDQRVILVAAFGGITGFLGSLGHPFVEARNFHSADCKGNNISIGNGCARISSTKDNPIQTDMLIGSSFPVSVSVGDAENIDRPGLFLNSVTEPVETPMVRMECPVKPGQTVEGYFVVLHNSDESALDRWLSLSNPVEVLKEEIRKKKSAIKVATPDHMLDLTVPPNVIAMDACWRQNTFCHGAYAWHCPYMGWRNWYGPTVIGWHERVKTAFRTHASSHVKKAEGTEEVGYKGPDQMSYLKNSYGFIPEIPDGRTKIFYNMQEVGIDMVLHNLEWTGDLLYAKEIFKVISEVLDWEERILDPDSDGLYQNWLNTWISDAHSYNGGGCAQSSVYNYRANRLMAKIASRIGRDPKIFSHRAEKIKKACQEILWLPDRGVMAEYIDTVGNRLIHPSPELATIYHSIEMGMCDLFQSYQMLKFTETSLRNERTIARNGRLVWSSNWYPQNYSSCGLYAAENIHLAWAYFMCGQADKGYDIQKGIVDAHFLGRYPGLVAHCMTESGYSDGAADFSEISSMYLRLIVEGLFGVRFHLLDGYVEISPNFPFEWEHAQLSTEGISIQYNRSGSSETYNIRTSVKAKYIIRLRLRSTKIHEITLNGASVKYQIEAQIGSSFAVIEIDKGGNCKLTAVHSNESLPSIQHKVQVIEDESVSLSISEGSIVEMKDPSGCLRQIKQNKQTIQALANKKYGSHTIFVLVKKDEWEAWLPVHIIIEGKQISRKLKSNSTGNYTAIDILEFFNCSLSEIHTLEYWKPRPKGYSIMTRLNGRFGWDWNQRGYNAVEVDDTKLRMSKGVYRVDSGLSFDTPPTGNNAACVSIWENFPEKIIFPLSGKGTEIAVFFIGVTNPMQSRVENGRFCVEYYDGTGETSSLINPVNFDDWLNASVQKENETVYFSDFNHGIVQRIVLDPTKELKSFTALAVANEVIIGILGISLRKK